MKGSEAERCRAGREKRKRMEGIEVLWRGRRIKRRTEMSGVQRKRGRETGRAEKRKSEEGQRREGSRREEKGEQEEAREITAGAKGE